jgi:hypothetical protein
MLILNRLVVWSCEMLGEAILVGTFLFVLAWSDQNTPQDLVLAIAGTAGVFMFGSGYFLTTAIFGVVWRSQKPWVYPAIAAALFIAHVQFYITTWSPSKKAPVQAGGACIVFMCTYVGGYFLREWMHAEKMQGK